MDQEKSTWVINFSLERKAIIITMNWLHHNKKLNWFYIYDICMIYSSCLHYELTILWRIKNPQLLRNGVNRSLNMHWIDEMGMGHGEAIFWFIIYVYCLYMIARPCTLTIYRYFASLNKHTVCTYMSHSFTFQTFDRSWEWWAAESIYIVNQDTYRCFTVLCFITARPS